MSTSCQRCGRATHLFKISAKCADMCSIRHEGKEFCQGYVPENLGIGGGDYLKIDLCTYCGQVQGNWRGLLSL